MKDNKNTRRKFLGQIGATALVSAAIPFTTSAAQEKAEQRMMRYDRTFSANDKIRIGGIGFGVQGHVDLNAALEVPGVEEVAMCDLYKGRIHHIGRAHY